MNKPKWLETKIYLQSLEDFLGQQKKNLDEKIKKWEYNNDSIQEYKTWYEREIKFYNKVYDQSKRFITAHKNPVLLFDIDETISTRSIDQKDLIRPSFIFVVRTLKKEYPNIKIGILSSRRIEFCIPEWLQDIVDKNFVFSSREYINDRYTPEAEKYKAERSTNWYINKVNAYADIENKDSKHQFLLIDDILRWDNPPLEKQGKAIDTYECVFFGEMLWLDGKTAELLIQNTKLQQDITKKELVNVFTNIIRRIKEYTSKWK